MNYLFIIIINSFAINLINSITSPMTSITWSIYNDWFKAGTNHEHHVIDVRLGEFINIICPKYTLDTASPQTIEYHSLYQVSKDEYDTCALNMNNAETTKQILRCDRPFDSVKYTLYISQFSPVPNALEFQPGSSYYFISTSNITFNGLNNTQGGTCTSNNMRISLRVIDSNLNNKDFSSSSTPTNDNTHKSQQQQQQQQHYLHSHTNSLHKKTSLINFLVTHTLRPLTRKKITTKDVILVQPDGIEYIDDDVDDTMVMAKLKFSDTYSSLFYKSSSVSYFQTKMATNLTFYIIYLIIMLS